MIYLGATNVSPLNPPVFLHIVSFDIPYPANYGGIITIFHQIKALYAQGVKIYLHCFQYSGREPQPMLERYCQEVYYYRRHRSWLTQLHRQPFIMYTRADPALLDRLAADEHPILFEGMHTCAWLGHPRLNQRLQVVRMHNVEWQYYAHLARLTPYTQLFKKCYYQVESSKLRRIEPTIIAQVDAILTLSAHDQAYYRTQKPATYYIPAFHPYESVESQPGYGQYVLFHGKLSVADNERAAIWLLKTVFSRLTVPCIIAGMDPSTALQKLAAQYAHVQLIANPDEQRMHELIAQAHIHLLVSFQVAGIKLKLLNALFLGRFCIANQEMVSGSGLDSLCTICDSASAIIRAINTFMNRPFDSSYLEARRIILEREFSNTRNAKKLIGSMKYKV